MSRLFQLLWPVVVAWMTGGAAWGGELRNEPVGARITLAKDRILIFTDTVARQASVAYPLASSTNPAADDFVRTAPIDYKAYGLLINSNVFFNNGGGVTGTAGIGSVRFEDAGAVTVAYVFLDSHEGNSRQGDDFALRSNEFLLGYSHRITDYLAVGGEVQFTDSKLHIQDTFMGLPRRSKSDTFGVGFDVGVLMALHETFFVGLHGGIKWDDTDTEGAVELPGTQIPFQLSDTMQISEIRWGIGWRPKPVFGAYVDWQYVHVEDDFGTTEVGRMFVGTEFAPNEDLMLRASVVFDTQPQAGFSVGLGYYGFKRVPLEMAYTYNTFPEVSREFGRAHLLSLSAVVLFK